MKNVSQKQKIRNDNSGIGRNAQKLSKPEFEGELN